MKKFRFSLKKLFIFIIVLNVGYFVIYPFKNTVIQSVFIFDYVKDFKDSELAPLKKYFTTSRIWVENSKITGLGFKSLGTLRYFEQLDLINNEITNDGLACISHLKQLVSLTLKKETLITDRGFLYLKNLKKLKKLNLSQTKISNLGLTSIQELPLLEELRLDETEITDEGLKSLETLSNLSLLSLNGTKITSAGLCYLKNLKNLKILLLKNTQTADEGVSQLVTLQNLQMLDLSSTQITNASLVHVEKLKNIRYIERWNTKLELKELKKIIEISPYLEGLLVHLTREIIIDINYSTLLIIVNQAKSRIRYSGLLYPNWEDNPLVPENCSVAFFVMLAWLFFGLHRLLKLQHEIPQKLLIWAGTFLFLSYLSFWGVRYELFFHITDIRSYERKYSIWQDFSFVPILIHLLNLSLLLLIPFFSYVQQKPSRLIPRTLLGILWFFLAYFLLMLSPFSVISFLSGKIGLGFILWLTALHLFAIAVNWDFLRDSPISLERYIIWFSLVLSVFLFACATFFHFYHSNSVDSFF